MNRKIEVGDWVAESLPAFALYRVDRIDESGNPYCDACGVDFNKDVCVKVEVKFPKKKLTLEEGLVYLASRSADLKTSEGKRPFWIEDANGDIYDNNGFDYPTAIEALQAFYEETSEE